jgi:DNA mismatch repair protein MutL
MERLVAPLANGGQSRLAGFVSVATMSRPDRDNIFLSLNGRPILNRALLDGIEAGYRPLYPRGRHPIAVVRVTLPPSHIDANVHPSKREVRVMDEAALRADLTRAVRAALEATVAPPGGQADLTLSLLMRGDGERQASSGPPGDTDGGPLALKLVASASRGLLVAESAEGLYLVDQHRAHERLIYNCFRQRHRPAAMEREELVEPIVLELPPVQARKLSSRLGELEEAGIVCEQFGGRSFIVRAAPQALTHEAVAGSLEETLGDEQELWLDRLLASLACRSAVHKGATMPAAEQEALIDGLARTYAPTVCPHGSPVLLHLSDDFLRRQFGW